MEIITIKTRTPKIMKVPFFSYFICSSMFKGIEKGSGSSSATSPGLYIGDNYCGVFPTEGGF